MWSWFSFKGEFHFITAPLSHYLADTFCLFYDIKLDHKIRELGNVGAIKL